MPDDDDPVSHPAHYTRGRIEVIDFLEDQGFNFHLANAVKYICRAGYKSADPTEDLRKAMWYIQRFIEKQMDPPPADPQPDMSRLAGARRANERAHALGLAKGLPTSVEPARTRIIEELSR